MNLPRATASLLLIPIAALLLLTACGSSDPEVTGLEIQVDSVGVDDGTVAPAPGNGLPLGAGPYAIATLAIEVAHPDADTVLYELACFGDTATLLPDSTPGVSAAAACTALADPLVEAYLVDGPPSDEVCTEIYGGPDTATLVGRVNDRPVQLTVDRANGCGIDAWDNLLSEVLPPALGVL